MRFRTALLFLVACAAMRQVGAQTALAHAAKPSAAPATIVYRNAQYGFCFVLPASWKGYTIVTDQWNGEGPGTKERTAGPKIIIRHPKWTEGDPREDIPIMIFTLDEWTKVNDEDISVSAAPFLPDVLGSNDRYVFALPPRYDYDENTGWKEVVRLMSPNPLRAPCGKAASSKSIGAHPKLH